MIKRLFADIEVSPNVVLSFGIGYNLTINHDAIVHERKVICIGYKWEGDKKTKVLRWDANQDDKDLLRDFLLIAEQADEIVAHFGDRFDIPWLRTRCLIHRLNPIPLYKTIDTKAWAAKNFYFNSNKLDYVSKVLGHGGKDKMEFSDWKDIVLYGCPKAMDKMCRYCAKDVDKLELVYQDLAPYVKPKTHVGVLGGREKWTCPRDGSRNVAVSKRRISASGTVTYQMKCKTCGAYYTISNSVYEDYCEWRDKQSQKNLVN